LSHREVTVHEREIAKEALRACGPAAVPALSSVLMSDVSPLPSVIRLLQDNGNLGCQVLCERLKKDTRLWKTDVRELKPGWSDLMQNANRESLTRKRRLDTDRLIVMCLGSMKMRRSTDASHRELAMSSIEELAKLWLDEQVLSLEAPSLLEKCNKAALGLRLAED